MQTTVSVIIPMYNAENTISTALHSVVTQTAYQSIVEIIIINDGSTDRSAQIVMEFMQEHPECNILLLEQINQGVSAARNAGLHIAKGNYIALLDSDDVWLPHKTEMQLEVFNKNKKVDFLVGLRNNEKIWFPYKIGSNGLAKITLRKLLIRIDGQTSTTLFKRKILENTGYFDQNQKYSEDANYWMKISEKNNMYILAEQLTVTGNGKKSFGVEGLSANIYMMEKGIQKNLQEVYHNKRINRLEYNFFYLFSKIKYFVRILRVKYGF